MGPGPALALPPQNFRASFTQTQSQMYPSVVPRLQSSKPCRITYAGKYENPTMAVEEVCGVHSTQLVPPEVRQRISPSKFFQNNSVLDITAIVVV